MADTCETCGREQLVPVPGGVHLCGKCAEDWQTPEGKKRIDRRRKANGLPPLDNPENAPEGAER
jgi:hypothetical protein